MQTGADYRDIPRQERKRLSTEAFRLVPKLRLVQFAAVLFAILLSGPLADTVVHRNEGFLLHLGMRVAFAVIISAGIWSVFGRPRLKAEVMKLRKFHP